MRNYLRYTEEEERYIMSAYENGKSAQEIAKKLGRKIYAIRNKISRLRKERESK